MNHEEKRWFDLPAVLSLSAALLLAAARLSATEWTENLHLVITLTFIALALGLALGYSRFRARTVGLFGLVFTLFFIPWQLGLTMGAGIAWQERLASMAGRLSQTISLFSRNLPSNDPLLFIANMALLFWLIALISSYHLVRYGRPWQTLIVAGITLIIVDLYSPGVPRSNFYSGTFVLLILLLLTQVFFMRSRRRWQEQGISIDSDTELNLGKGALVGALVLVFLAWNLPTLVLAFNPGTIQQQQLSDAWSDFRQRFENATAPLQGPLRLEQEFFGREMGLGTGSPLSDELVMTIKASSPQKPEGTAYYWRGRSYDYYNGETGIWENSPTQEVEVVANGVPLPYPDWKGRVRGRFTVSTHKNLGLYYTPSLPLLLTRPSRAVQSDLGDGQVDLIALRADPSIRGGETYEVVSWLSAPTVRDMLSASAEYPSWVQERYLQLPEDMPQDIRRLAEEITAGQETAYEKAVSVTNWLRDNITYQAVIDPIPAGQDPIEHFLFETRTGFCNYYATAEILMLRAVGVPARLAVGYAQGEFNSETGEYEVRRKESHSWPEIYFEGIGWVEFEPTVSQPGIDRLPGSDESGQEFTPPNSTLNERDPLDEERDPRDREEEIDMAGAQNAGRITWQLITVAAAVVLLAAAGGWYFLQRRANRIEPLPALLEAGMRRRGWNTPVWIIRWARLTRLNRIERAFLTVELALQALRKPSAASATPAEAVRALQHELPESSAYAQDLLDQYQRSMYSRTPGDENEARRASRQIWRTVLRHWAGRLLGEQRAPGSPGK